MMKSTLYLIFILLVIAPAHATFQIPERVFYQNKQYETLDEPLIEYISAKKIDLYSVTDSLCSANWRGYVAQWVINDGSLYLKSLYVNACVKEKKIPLQELIPEAQAGLFKADWFTGKIKLYRGDVYGGESPAHILEFENGRLVN